MNVGDDFSQYAVNGQKNTISIQDWVSTDTDTTSADYAAYRSKGTGNGKRVITVVVNDMMNTGRVVGFATFFLYTADQYGGKNYCGEYIGFSVRGAPVMPPGSGSGVYHIRLLQ